MNAPLDPWWPLEFRRTKANPVPTAWPTLPGWRTRVEHHVGQPAGWFRGRFLNRPDEEFRIIARWHGFKHARQTRPRFHGKRRTATVGTLLEVRAFLLGLAYPGDNDDGES